MLSVVCWRWGTAYGVEYINRLRSMLSRHLDLPHCLYCVTDDPAGLDSGIIPVPIWPANDLGRARRLRIFDESMRGLFGQRILQLDIDCVITGDITPLVNRSEPFVIWRSVPELWYGKGSFHQNSENGKGAYNTSMLLVDTGILPTLWGDYCADPRAVEEKARKAGMWTMLKGTVGGQTKYTQLLAPGDDDQAVISLYARDLNPPTWLECDGVYKVGRRGFSDKSTLPENARIVFFNGSLKENQPGEFEWIKQHWR